MKVFVNAANARMGGAATFAREFLPHLRNVLEDDYQAEMRAVVDMSPLALQASARTLTRDCDVVFNAANVAMALTSLPQVVAVRNRLLIEPQTSLNELLALWPDHERAGVRRALRLRRLALVHALRASQVWIVPTESMREALYRFCVRNRFSLRHIEVISHGVASADVTTRPPALPLPPPFGVFYPALYTPYKNMEMLIRVLARLGSNAFLTLPIHGPAALRSLAHHVGADVRFVGTLDRDAMIRAYATHHAVVYPSRIEAFGLPLLEAGRYGHALIASDRDWAREVAGHSAMYVDPEDEAGWLTALRQLAESPKQRSVRLPAANPPTWRTAAISYADCIYRVASMKDLS